MFTRIKIALMIAVIVSSRSGCRARHIDRREESIVNIKVDSWRPDGYGFAYQTSFGTTRREIGYLKTFPDGTASLITEGEFSYFDSDGKYYRVVYTADENGYHPRLDEPTANVLNQYDDDDDNDSFVFPEDENTLRTSTQPSTTTTVSSLETTTTSPQETTEYDGTTPAAKSLDPSNADEVLDTRYGLPPGLVGSLLGTG